MLPLHAHHEEVKSKAPEFVDVPQHQSIQSERDVGCQQDLAHQILKIHLT